MLKCSHVLSRRSEAPHGDAMFWHTAQIPIICENNSFPAYGVVYHKEKTQKMLIFTCIPFEKMISAKIAIFFVPTPPSDLNTLVLHGASLFFVVSLASLLDCFQHLMCLVHYYRHEFTNGFVKKWLGHVANCIGISAFHVPWALLWTNLGLVGLNHPKQLLVGACLCCGLQSWSPTA